MYKLGDFHKSKKKMTACAEAVRDYYCVSREGVYKY